MTTMNSGYFHHQYPSTVYEPQSSLPWYVGKTIDTKDITTIGGRSHELITNASDNCEVIGTERRADGREYPVLLGTMESPELARFVVNAANTFHRNSTTDLTPQELLKATETAINNAELDKVTDKDLKEELAQSRKREYAAVSMLRQAREELEQARRSLTTESGQRREAQNRLSDFRRMNALQETTIMHLKNKLDVLEKEKAERLARDSGVIKTMSNGRKMRFKERSDD